MRIIFSKKCLEYQSYGHPESPQRVKVAYDLLKGKGYDFIEAKPCPEKDILRVHSPRLLKQVKDSALQDPETPNLEGIFEYARLSCGAAIQALEFALNNERTFSLMRPPGHHANRDTARGFCYFNNIAVAVSKVLDKIKKIAILDIDCHHGNGTQDIFLGEERVLYVSLHQSPLYPGTGLKSVNNCLNFPLPAATSEELYLNTLSDAIEEIKRFDPQIIGVSCGFDTYKDDPLTNFNLEKNSYFKIAELVSSLDRPLFSVLEGGYNIAEIGECVEQYLKGCQ